MSNKITTEQNTKTKKEKCLMGRVDGKTALVTGASRGIGRAIAIELAREGAKVAINYSSSDAKAKEVAEKITNLGGTAIFCPLIVCILTAPPDGASRVPTSCVSRPGSSMVPGIMEFMNPYYRHFLLLRYIFLRLH
jgi:hypothetical protein